VSALRVVLAVLARDAKKEISYPMTVAMGLVGLLVQATLWRYTARFVGAAVPSASIPGGDWFGFVVVGWAFLRYLQVSLFTFSQSLREEQLAGTLELLLSSPQPEGRIVVALGAWDYVYQTISIAIFLGIASLFGVQWNFGGVLPAAAAIAATLAAYVGIGLLSAAFTITWKKGTALAVAASSLATLFGGVIYPVETLGRLEWVSRLVPATYVARSLRTVLLAGGGFREIASDLGALALFAAVLLPAGFVAFRASVERAKRNGTLGAY
jgi:ABC-2 type transport system permease protein